MLEAVVNVSEGRRQHVVDAIAAAAGEALLDVHVDGDHHRAVLTLAGDTVEVATRAVATETVRLVDLRDHHGVHPRLGAVDVVPFVPLDGSTFADAIAARDRFAAWAGATLGVPCFLYGPERSLPDVRRLAFRGLGPDTGPAAPHPTAGATAVGARNVLVAYNVWLDGSDVTRARAIATELRGAHVRALGLSVTGGAQVSMNLVDPLTFGPAEAYDAVASRAAVARAELVGLVPAAVVRRVPPSRWHELDLDEGRTIEARLARRALP